MSFVQPIFFLLIFFSIDCSIYVTHTEDSLSTEFYDCVYSYSARYCRRPLHPIGLQRDTHPWNCSHNGTVHSFESLWMNKVDVNTVLYQWKSGLDKTEEYSRYLNQSSKSNNSNSYICECTYPGSFGKHCEYLLPVGTRFDETVNAKFDLYSNISISRAEMICYSTLKCDYGLLCLDWRDICNGVQNCMLGYDEENCDRLEFNECEKDEYRCMNGMCIPDEYFLDGVYDCMDMSDEKEHFNGINCPLKPADMQCDDRLCPADEWPCGDGQCIKDRLAFQTPFLSDSGCINQRHQFYLCETNLRENLWTLSHGQCVQSKTVQESPNIDNCTYLFKCALSSGAKENCPCGTNRTSCLTLLNRICGSSRGILYPHGGILAPYIFHYYYPRWFHSRSNSSFIVLNGTIKCRGHMISFIKIEKQLSIFNLRTIEASLCASISNQPKIDSHQFCYNDSCTSNNRSYNFFDVCPTSKECISAYRIKDGIDDCADKTDEQQNEIVSKSCVNLQRHRFRCSKSEPTCLYANTLGDSNLHCKNRYDESWMDTSTLLVNINCSSQSKSNCRFLRRYIESSWNSDASMNSTLESFSAEQIPFRAYCDTFWDLSSKQDENIEQCRSSWVCRQEQWQCDTGQCIDSTWVLDGEWDCPDASDEEAMLAVNFSTSHHNSEQLRNNEFIKNFTEKYGQGSLHNVCNLTYEYPCLLANTTYSSLNNTRPCIDLKLIGNGEIDCLGGYDEHSAIQHCDRFSTLGYDFKCLSTDTCITHLDMCSKRCPNNLDDDLWCRTYRNIGQYFNSRNFQCLNGIKIDKERCNGKHDCLYGEDEYMCNRGTSSDHTIYRKQKQLYVRTAKQELQLPRFPTYTNSQKVSKDNVAAIKNISKPIIVNSSILVRCNRGIAILMFNGAVVCFCPPQYHGDQCQYHSDRITILLHLNFIQSIYAQPNAQLIVIKLLVLFLFEDQVLSSDEFHVRPAVERDGYRKKSSYLDYSRSARFIDNKQQRYFNRSNIILEHPYSVRIEAYEMRPNEVSRRIAVWQYPIYFDFLPVHRFSKVLHLFESNKQDYQPCNDHPCNSNQECFQLLNDRRERICLCKKNFFGSNCSELHPMCNNNYCSSQTLCQPGYRSLMSNQHLPYCICPYGYSGKRCELHPNVCSQNPCQNGGRCGQRSGVDEYACHCTEQYDGTNCERQKQSVRFAMNKSNTAEYQGIVLQYFYIDFSKLELSLAYQNPYMHLPDYFMYFHNRTNAPEIILLKLYTNQQAEVYLISLHVDVVSINATTYISEENRCIQVQSLSSTNKGMSVFEYHRICRNNPSLLCFLDGIYICICNKKNTAAECFIYDNQLDQCANCQANGLCLKGGEKGFLCLCPACHSGSTCQFNFESFSFTLDQLFLNDLLSNNRIIRQMSFTLLIITPCLLFLLGLVNNTFCFMTFRRPNCLRNGIGQYLFYMSIINQINLTVLVVRLIHLTMNIADPYSYPVFDDTICKTSTYLLTCSTRMTYWLSSLVAIERMYVAIVLNGHWLKKPHIARRLIVLVILSILIMSAYELVFIQSQINSDDGNNAICVLNLPLNHSFWNVSHKVITIMNALAPFMINFCCTIAIVYVVTKKRMDINVRGVCNLLEMTTAINHQEDMDRSIEDGNEPVIEKSNKNKKKTIIKRNVNSSVVQLSPMDTQSRFRLLIDVFMENKELIVAPAFTLVPQIFSLPFFIASFSLQCENFQTNRLRYLLIVSYFTTFIPQLTSFFLYISPSSFYSKEWSATTIGKWIATFKQHHQPGLSMTNASYIDGTTK